MKIRKIWICSVLGAAVLAGAGCAQKQAGATVSQSAGKQETAERQKEAAEGMEPIYAAALKDGIYQIQVDSSSPMFRAEKCELTVKDGSLTARMTMSGSGYARVFMGTGEDAEKASESQWIPSEDTREGKNEFTVPVEALDRAVACSAFSKRKGTWYDRTLVFRADSLPAEAFKEGNLTTVETLGLKDGSYTAVVRLEGGSGRAGVESPANLRIMDGKALVTLVWSSPNYDYMKVGEEQFEQQNTEGNSVFEIPVTAFDYKQKVIADTIAMSTPHEIEYTLIVESAGLKEEGE